MGHHCHLGLNFLLLQHMPAGQNFRSSSCCLTISHCGEKTNGAQSPMEHRGCTCLSHPHPLVTRPQTNSHDGGVLSVASWGARGSGWSNLPPPQVPLPHPRQWQHPSIAEVTCCPILPCPLSAHHTSHPHRRNTSKLVLGLKYFLGDT